MPPSYRQPNSSCCFVKPGEVNGYLGEAYLDRLAEKRVTLRLVERLNALGYNVELRPRAAA